VQDGVLPAAPESLAQGNDGYLWIGTTGGLFRFDGVRVVPWTSEHGEKLASNHVTALLGTRDGSLWIGSEGGLDRLRDGRLTRISTEPSMVLGLHAGTNDRIWVVRSYFVPIEKSLCWVIGERLECPAPLEGLDLAVNSCCAYGFTQSADGSIWLGGDTALLHWQAGATSSIRPAALKANRGMGGVQAIAETKRGELWVGMGVTGPDGGLQRLVNGALQPLVSPTVDTSSLMVYALYRDSQDALWVGTGNQGLLRIHDKRVERFRSGDGLSSDAVLRIFEQRVGRNLEGARSVSRTEGAHVFHARGPDLR
jgi:ligand-binding sensor domain-containing protein